jgi:hypothetical protein
VSVALVDVFGRDWMLDGKTAERKESMRAALESFRLRLAEVPATDDARDAARYRWLRADPAGRHTLNGGIPWCVHVVTEHGMPTMKAIFDADLDAAVDSQSLAGEGA